MTSKSGNQITIHIEYDNFLTHFELNKILSTLDNIIVDEILYELHPRWRHLLWRYGQILPTDLSYIGITTIGRGSITLTLFVSGAVAAYVARHFIRGIDESILSDELKRSGQIAGNRLGYILKEFNDRMERYVEHQRMQGSNIRSIKARLKSKNSSKTNPKQRHQKEQGDKINNLKSEEGKQ